MAVLTKIATGAAVAAGSPFNGSWTNEQNARVAVSDLTAAGSGTYATCAPGKNQEFASLWPFVFSEIPAGSTINSVTVTVQWKVSTTSSVASLRSTLFADAAGAPDQAAPLSASPGTERTSSQEVTVDTNGTYSATCTAAQLIQGVWVRVQALRGNTNTGVTASLDYVRVAVDYTEPPAATPYAADLSAPALNVDAQPLARFNDFIAQVSAASFALAGGALTRLNAFSRELTAAAFSFTPLALTWTATAAGFVVELSASAFAMSAQAVTRLSAFAAQLSAPVFAFAGRTLARFNAYVVALSAPALGFLGYAVDVAAGAAVAVYDACMRAGAAIFSHRR